MRPLSPWLAAAGIVIPFSTALADVCVNSACGHLGAAYEQPKIPDAENILFTDTGRLFVSGGKNVYEIVASPNAYNRSAWISYGGSANFTGLAQIGSTVYALSFDGTLFALDLNQHLGPWLVPIQKLSGLTAANGMVDGPDGELYIVNGPLATSSLPDPKILRVKLDPANPQHVIEQVTWLQGDSLLFPNGLARRGRTLYLTDHNAAKPAIGSIGAVDILADGSPGTLRQIAHFPAIPDDLALYGNDFLVAEYSSGTVARFGPDGTFRSQIRIGTIPGASSVEIGQPPLYQATDLLITQKGVLGIDDGDKLVVWHAN